jgi:hypothetical protein
MQPNYEEMMKKQQQDYQRSRDPFQYGQQVAQRRYSEIMSNLDMQRDATQQSYGDLYSQARQRAVRGQAMGGPTLSGGMGQQQRDFVSAIEMQELGRIGQAREGSMRDLYSQGQAAFSNAQLEGQQATQMEVQNRQTAFQLAQQRQTISNDANLNDAQKTELLQALDGATSQANTGLGQTPATFGQNVVQAGTILSVAGIGTGAVAKGLAASARALNTTKGILASGKILGSVGAKNGVTQAAKALAASAKASKGLGAVWLGAKAGLIKLGLAKGSVLAGGKLALAGLGPVGWGILGLVGLSLAVGGILTLAQNNNQ